MEITQAYAKDLSNLAAIVSWASDQQRHGSFSDRRPDLGRMFRCPYCHVRRRANGPRCCNPAFATTKRAWTPELGFHQTECEERSNASVFSKSFLRKLRHKKHGQSRAFTIRHQTLLFQRDPELLKAAVKEMQTQYPLVQIPDLSAIPAFAARYWAWKQKQAAKAARKRRR